MKGTSRLDGIFKDQYYLLFEQCIRDAESLRCQMIPRSADGSWNWNEELIVKSNIACSLFNVRSMKPTTAKELQELFVGAELSKVELDDIKAKYEEYVEITKSIDEKKKSMRTLVESFEREQTRQKAEKFAENVFGSASLNLLDSRGYIEVIGSNQKKYRICKNGSISKLGFNGWNGNISDTSIPMLEAIVTVYEHILSNADKFDKEKGCGQISINT